MALWGLVLVPWNANLTIAPPRLERGTSAESFGYAVWWPGAVLGLGLLAAAYAKLDTSGLQWVLGGAAKYHFVEDFQRAPTTWGLWIATHPAWAVAASCVAVAIEGLVVIHLFFREWFARAIAGMAVLALLGGLYLLQGHFWPLWWVMLLAFVPWDSLGRVVLRTADARALAVQQAIPKYSIVCVTAIVCVQLFASARRVEVEPFVSDYGMYSWTWPSTDVFDRQITRKYRVYHFVVAGDSGNVDITSRLQSLPKAIDTLADAVDRSHEGGDLGSSDRDALRTVGVMYQSAFSAPISKLTVLRDEQAFDWQRGRFYQSANRQPTGTIDLSSGEFHDWGHE